MNCADRKDLLLLYAMDALEATEAAELRRHLSTGCPTCTGHLAEAQALMGTIPLGLDPIAPPANLKSRLMARIADADAVNPRLQNTPRKTGTVAGDPLAMRLFRYLVPAAVAAGLAIIATHAVVNKRVIKLQQEALSLRHENQFSSMVLTSQAQQLELLQGNRDSQTKVVELLRSPGVLLVPLKPTALQPHAVANLLWDKKQKQWAIITDGMAPAPQGQTYELWFVPKTGAPVEAGTFNVDASGRASLRVTIPDNLGPMNLAAVTNEAAGGVDAPKGEYQITSPEGALGG